MAKIGECSSLLHDRYGRAWSREHEGGPTEPMAFNRYPCNLRHSCLKNCRQPAFCTRLPFCDGLTAETMLLPTVWLLAYQVQRRTACLGPGLAANDVQLTRHAEDRSLTTTLSFSDIGLLFDVSALFFVRCFSPCPASSIDLWFSNGHERKP